MGNRIVLADCGGAEEGVDAEGNVNPPVPEVLLKRLHRALRVRQLARAQDPHFDQLVHPFL